jgi:hypothetical protein
VIYDIQKRRILYYSKTYNDLVKLINDLEVKEFDLEIEMAKNRRERSLLTLKLQDVERQILEDIERYSGKF